MSEKVSTWVSVLEDQAASRPDSRFLYVVYQDRSITYGEQDRNANRFAHYFLRLGAKPGDGVAVLMNNSPQFLDVFFGIQKIGMYINTVNTALKGDGLAFIIDNSDTKFLVVDHDLVDLYRSVAKATPQIKTVIVNTLEAPEG
ncbi:MAG TPA: AMP-binding protein, partial [Desulfomonilia bacterium]|nr:AMP-binding protein [Desulfomonilia bacterium]